MSSVALVGQAVAPFTGAWIEIGNCMLRPCLAGFLSHPSRVRGLKSVMSPMESLTQGPSHPSRVRGLKYAQSFLLQSRRRRTLHGCVD